MTVSEWVGFMSRHGGVCNDYMRKLAAVEGKSDMFRVLCDANGGAWLFGLHAKGVPLPTEAFMEEYKLYVNGRHVVPYPQGYSSKMYCRYSGELVADTTLVYLLECSDVDITVPKYSYPSVILSKGCSVKIAMEPGSRLNVETYGGAKYSISGDMSRVRIKNH